MKKSLSIALILILALCLFAGCGSKEVTWTDYQAFLKESFSLSKKLAKWRAFWYNGR